MAKETTSRRDFLKLAGAAGAVGLTSGGDLLAQAAAEKPKAAGAEDAPSPKKPEQPMVPHRPLGKTGVSVPALGLGMMFDTGANLLVLKQAYKWGVRYWDTADCYEGGGSEEGVGKYFKRWPEDRKDIFLVTKSDDRDDKGMSRLLAQSFERMNTDYIDLYLLHGVSSPEELSPEVAMWAMRMKQEGKIKLFGFSTHANMPELLQHAAGLDWIDGIMTSYNYRVMHEADMKKAVDACHARGIGLLTMKTQAGGPITGLLTRDEPIANRFLTRGFTTEQAKVKAVWENPAISAACLKMSNLSLLSMYTAAALDKTSLSKADIEAFASHDADTQGDFCAGCASRCEPAVDGDAPVADVMRFLMYHRAYGETERARSHFAELPAGVRGALTSHDYRAAEAACPRGLPIATLMREATRELA